MSVTRARALLVALVMCTACAAPNARGQAQARFQTSAVEMASALAIYGEVCRVGTAQLLRESDECARLIETSYALHAASRLSDAGVQVGELLDLQTQSAATDVPFGLVQSGDVLIESFEHGLEVFAMEPGRVRNGRALAAERVLTNPLSGADAALLATYLRGELRGRPLRGVYTLTIPGRPEIEWQALREIQVLLNYRFWVRQD